MENAIQRYHKMQYTGFAKTHKILTSTSAQKFKIYHIKPHVRSTLWAKLDTLEKVVRNVEMTRQLLLIAIELFPGKHWSHSRCVLNSRQKLALLLSGNA